MARVAKEIHFIAIGKTGCGKSALLNAIIGYPIFPHESTWKPLRVKVVRNSDLADEDVRFRFFKDGKKEDNSYDLPEEAAQVHQRIASFREHGLDALDDRASFAQLEKRKAQNIIVTDVPGLLSHESDTKLQETAEFISAKYVEAKYTKTHILYIISARDFVSQDFKRQCLFLKKWGKNAQNNIYGCISHLDQLDPTEQEMFLTLFKQQTLEFEVSSVLTKVPIETMLSEMQDLARQLPAPWILTQSFDWTLFPMPAAPDPPKKKKTKKLKPSTTESTMPQTHGSLISTTVTFSNVAPSPLITVSDSVISSMDDQDVKSSSSYMTVSSVLVQPLASNVSVAVANTVLSDETGEWQLEVVKELHPVFQADFEESEENILAWLILADEQRVKEYLTKLLTQVKIASRILLAVERLNFQHAKKLVTLWKCAKRRDVTDYFKKKAQTGPKDKTPASFLGPAIGTSPVSTHQHQPVTYEKSVQQILGTANTLTGYEWLLEDGSYIPYPAAHCQILETKDEERFEGDIKLEAEGKVYHLSLKHMTQTNVCSQMTRHFRRVHQWPRCGPLIWSTMDELSTCELRNIPINGNVSPELDDIMRAFRQGCPDYEILSAEVNYNPEKWLLYWTLREDYRKRIPQFQERSLWHGTDGESVKLICAQGFKRDLVKNFNYGRGCYFARSPMLSIRLEYARPSNNVQKMILCYVLIGDTIAGTKDMRQPPVKDENLLRYENTVDMMGSSKIYVTYDDHQVFPAIVLTVKHM